MNYDELADFAASIPRIPKRELKCHPAVVEALREEALWASYYRRSELWKVYELLLACPVFVDPLMEFGAWVIEEDGVVAVSGNLYP